MQHCKLLGLGHPRTGTGFTAKCLSDWGLDVKHEELGEDGIVAWQLFKEIGPYPFLKTNLRRRPSFDILIYNVRNPYYSLPSIVYTEDTRKQSFTFRKELYQNSNNKIENAIESIYTIDQMINSLKPDVIYRIEDQVTELFKFLQNEYQINYKEQKNSKKINSRHHKDFDIMINEHTAVSGYHKQKINSYCNKHGYMNIF